MRNSRVGGIASVDRVNATFVSEAMVTELERAGLSWSTEATIEMSLEGGVVVRKSRAHPGVAEQDDSSVDGEEEDEGDGHGDKDIVPLGGEEKKKPPRLVASNSYRGKSVYSFVRLRHLGMEQIGQLLLLYDVVVDPKERTYHSAAFVSLFASVRPMFQFHGESVSTYVQKMVGAADTRFICVPWTAVISYVPMLRLPGSSFPVEVTPYKMFG